MKVTVFYVTDVILVSWFVASTSRDAEHQCVTVVTSMAICRLMSAFTMSAVELIRLTLMDTASTILAVDANVHADGDVEALWSGVCC